MEKEQNVNHGLQKGGPSMGEVRAYIDMCVIPGQSFTANEICQGVGAYSRNDKSIIYVYLGRLIKEGLIKSDTYKHGGFRRVLNAIAYDLGGATAPGIEDFSISLPLNLDKIIQIKPNNLIVISGRYDAGKSSFLFDVMQRNFHKHKIIHFASMEWSLDAIKERMDRLGIPRPHPHVQAFPMNPGYEDLIPTGHCIALVDYIRTNDNPRDIDIQFYRILENLKGGVCIAAIQKNPGVDRPTGGQFAIHAPHHVVLLDKTQQGDFICKVAKSKSEKNLEGLFRTFKFNQERKFVPIMDTWKKGEIRWDKMDPLQSKQQC